MGFQRMEGIYRRYGGRSDKSRRQPGGYQIHRGGSVYEERRQRVRASGRSVGGFPDPDDSSGGDAFYGARDSASIITHRVVENRVVMGEFITKGDANQTEDMNPVPYDNYLGTVVRAIPGMGRLAEILVSSRGKILAGCMIGAAVLLQILSSVLKRTAE